MNEGTHENSPFQSREICLEDLSDVRLNPGDTITGIHGAKDLDILEEMVADSIKQNDNVTLYRKNAFILSDSLRPTRFNGRLVDINALILPATHYDTILDENSRRIGPTVQLLITAGMHSTGRGMIGSTAAVATYTQNLTYNGTGPDVRRHISTARNIAKAEELVQQQITDSAQIHQKLASIALRRAFSAGLPTLGKR